MQLKELVQRLVAMRFRPASSRAAYEGAERFEHPDVKGGSVFVGDGPGVTWAKQRTTLRGTGAFLLANGRSRGMTAVLTALDSMPTGRIRDPLRRTPGDDDPYWRDSPDLVRLLAKMEGLFR
jgi:hypothetical protein